ncbi:nucleoside triphosphate pyrophosphohydrolase [Desulfovibrio inopinatus]|uniref:nucleoside triphosphate pyrophosphohydrolase n=1 Tax=Desulfovibrio inopinatus TaxID=102109 RepID=UPI00040FC390|nr:nucleoside triphosphate pyrophosphohydrolase [Desulfovibrio inopinatus]
MSAKDAHALEHLSQVLDTLLSPEGCPWDKAQTPKSLCDYIIEESFELVDAIRSEDDAAALEEVGDVLFLLLFVTKLYQRDGKFTLAQSIDAESAKMIRRHPHVFDDLEIANREELMRNWERIKRMEKKEGTSIFDSLPSGLPPLLKAYRIHSKAARVGFTWENDTDVKNALDAEWEELAKAQESGNLQAIQEEFGDYLFTLTEYGRRLGVKANTCLDHANKKFLDRFAKLEVLAKRDGKDIADMTLAELDALWDKVKLDPEND